MSPLSRRTFLRTSSVTGGAALALPAVGGAALAAPAAGTAERTGLPMTVLRDDHRYPGLLTGSNQRWVASPECVRLVRTADEVVWAVQEAMDSRRAIAVRSGGHCNEPFSCNASPVLIDLALMDEVARDERRDAFAVQPGATLGTVYKKLHRGWGVTIPGGTCPSVGMGGHIAGGGYGALSRMHGLTVDHLHAVEVVVVDANRRARKVVATSDPADPNHELWWAHTGGGGGSFGVVTKYWLRTPGTAGKAPQEQLPKPPRHLIVSDVSWRWADLDEAKFVRLLRNYTAFFARNSGPDSPYTALYSQLKPMHRAAGMFSMSTQIDASAPDAEGLLRAFLDAVNAGVGATCHVNDHTTVPWTYAAKEWFGFVPAAMPRWKAKSAYLRATMPRAQAAAFWRHLTREDYVNATAGVVLAAFGGRVNAVRPEATAAAQRDSSIKMLYVGLWTNPAEDAKHTAFVREFYRDVYAAAGGVPGPDAVNDGCFINYSDADMADPAINTSGKPWHELYFKGGYGRLQRAKAAYDPLNVFTHALAVRPL